MTAALPILGTETYISFDQANALAMDRIQADEWRAAVAELETERADEESSQEEGVPAPPIDPSIPIICRRALITATATLNGLTYAGQPVAVDQPLAWPRHAAGVASNAIPGALATACAELAFYLLSPEGRDRHGVQMVMIGQSMETYFPEVADDLPKHVRRLVEPFLRVRSKHSAELLF